MCARTSLYVPVVAASVAVWLLNGAAARVEASSSIEVQYLIHETSADPDSPVEYSVTLSLEETASDGNTIGWDITSVEILQVGDPTDTIWIDDDPYVPTQDGLWWVEHADIADPRADELTEPPYLQGTATAQDPSDVDLTYEFESGTYVPPEPEQQGPYDTTGAMSWQLTAVGGEGGEDPVDGGEDEPVDVPPVDDPWGTA